MAVLDAATRASLAARFNRDNDETCDGIKAEIRQLVDAMDDYLESNASAINTSIPVGIRAKFTPGQKAFALALVALKRYR